MDQLVSALRRSLDSDPAHELSTRIPVLVLDGFLPGAQVDQIMAWIFAHEDRFKVSEVIAAEGSGGIVDSTHRRSRVMFDADPLRQLFRHRLLAILETARSAVNLPRDPVLDIELQVTASNDGDFFRQHSDNTHATLAGRSLTFVYFLKRVPESYRGGHLAIYETKLHEGRPVAGDLLLDVEPLCNRIAFFPSYLMHEVRTVECPSRAFVDGRFTINGWFVTGPRSIAHTTLRRRNRASGQRA